MATVVFLVDLRSQAVLEVPRILPRQWGQDLAARARWSVARATSASEPRELRGRWLQSESSATTTALAVIEVTEPAAPELARPLGTWSWRCMIGFP